MRILVMGAAAALLSACAGSVALPEPAPPVAGPFAATRGTAPPPPAGGVSTAPQAAPPEGLAPGGLDFAAWRGADPAVYQPQFAARVNQRLAGKDARAARADLEANGFACREQGPATECRIEIMERQCAHDWYVVLTPARETPISGYDVMCLGAR